MSQLIYPTKEELRGAVEAYLEANHTEWYHKFSEIQWTAFYNESIHKEVSSFLIIYF
jgi:hypothetical protein